jgi:L-arabinose transport system substrate-binding protein
MENVPYLGISARKIGNLVGETLIEQMKKRNWDIKEVGLCLLTYDEVDSVHERTEGTREAVIAAGFPESQIYSTPILQRVEIPTALDAANALLTKRSDVKYWLIASGNDNGVLGAVRAMEGKNIKADNAIGVGINGTDCIPELEKATPTSFYGSVLLSAREHGFMTAEMMYKWITEDKMPPLDTRTVGKLITRDNFVQVLKDEGVTD